MFCGGTDWALMGRGGGKKKSDAEKKAEEERPEKYPNLNLPHRLKTLTGIKIRFVAAGPAAAHCLGGDMEGKLYTWGRNERGQLGHGDTTQRNYPSVVTGLAGRNIITGAGGKFHSAVVTDDGKSYTFGSNAAGQLGTGSVKNSPKTEELLKSPVLAQVLNASQVGCGVDFTVWLCKGQLYSAGNPQYGQLGHGTDHEYNAKESSVKIMYQPQPSPEAIKAFKETTIRNFSVGHNHVVALDSEKQAWSWGNGGYGRLGHTVQQDEFKPRKIETFSGRMPVAEDSIVACGSTSSFACMIGDQLCAWGKLKASGDTTMYPKMYMELSGWQIRHMACGNTTFVCAAHSGGDQSVVTWGQALNQELGYGPNGKKSSANPEKCYALENVYTHQVAAGVGHMLFLVDGDSETVKKLDEFHPEVEVEPSKDEEEILAESAGKGTKAKGKGKAPPAKKRKAADEPAAKKAPPKKKAVAKK